MAAMQLSKIDKVNMFKSHFCCIDFHSLYQLSDYDNTQILICLMLHGVKANRRLFNLLIKTHFNILSSVSDDNLYKYIIFGTQCVSSNIYTYHSSSFHYFVNNILKICFYMTRHYCTVYFHIRTNPPPPHTLRKIRLDIIVCLC